jgi:hypothetical protein
MMHHDDKSKLKLLVTATLRNAVMLAALAPVCFAFPLQQVNRKSIAPHWSGTWVLQKPNSRKKNSQGIGNVTLVVSQTNQQVRVIRKLNENGNETVQELTYYTDGRGEANPSTDGKRTLRSTTQLRNDKIVIKFSPSTTINRQYIVNERVEEWKLSSDGQTMTQTTSFTSSSSANDASNNPFGRPRVADFPGSPLRWKAIRVFKRVP